MYYDGHHCQHNVGFLTFCDSIGVTRLVHGPVRGGANDINLWYSSDFYQNQWFFFGNCKVLFDRIYRFAEGPFICQIKNPIGRAQKLYNFCHTLSRSVIEHTYSRQKTYFPILGLKFPFNLKFIGLVYRVCVILTNVLIIHQNPMRQ